MKKEKKQIWLLYVAVLCLCLLAGCGSGTEKDGDKADAGSEMSSSLYDEGLELVSDIHELANDENYIELMGFTSDLREHIDKIAASDYDTPSGVYRVSNAGDIWSLAVLGYELEEGAMSEAAHRYLENTGARIVNLLIGKMGGAEQLATASTLRTSSCFVDAMLAEPEMYVYTYENAYPVFVSFVPGKNGAVSAYAQCLYLEDMYGADAEKINEAVSGTGYPVSLGLEEITE